MDETEAATLTRAPAGVDEWHAALEAMTEEAGDYRRLSDRHSVLFIDEGPRLLVTFESAAAVRARPPAGLPLGLDIVRPGGWSLLCFLAEGETWWRDPAVYAHVDRLVDDAFFEDFDHVAFWGAGAGGYAACAFSVAAPGATVLAAAPQATLDPAVAGWDGRFRSHRRRCFTDRYGFAPAMTEGAGRVFLAYDPLEPLDAMHAALFRGRHVVPLRMPGAGPQPEAMLSAMGLLPALLGRLLDGTLSAAAFAALWRARRDHAPWLRRLLARAAPAGPRRVERLCTAVLKRHDLPRFRRALRAAQVELAQAQRTPDAGG